MLYKLYNEGFVNSLDDSVTDYENSFFVKNPFGSAPITLRWGNFSVPTVHFYVFYFLANQVQNERSQ